MGKLQNKDNGIITQSDLKKPSVRVFYYCIFIICLIMTIVSIAPPILVFLSSFKDIKEFTIEPTLLPKIMDFSKFIKTWNVPKQSKIISTIPMQRTIKY